VQFRPVTGQALRVVDLRLLFLVRPLTRLPGGRVGAAALIVTMLLCLFWAVDVFGRTSVGGRAGSTGAALFFSIFLAYVIPIFGYITERTAAALAELRHALDVDDSEFARWQARIHGKPLLWLAWVILIGATCGMLHNLLLFGWPRELLQVTSASRAAAAVAVGTQITWTVTTVVNALLLNRAARRCRVEPFSPERLRPFARVAMLSTLALIGAQAVFPVMFVDDDLSALSYVPGLLATGIPIALLAVLPVWPVHRRIAVAKRRLLDHVNRRIADLPPADPGDPATVGAMVPLLAYRREIRAISEWPFDLGSATRFGLILVIPPLTWIGAALVERLLDAFL
jgi:hypothetical protein